MYFGLGAGCFVPLLHSIIVSNIEENNDYVDLMASLGYYIAACTSLVVGLLIYLQRCPERFKPGRFDIIG